MIKKINKAEHWHDVLRLAARWRTQPEIAKDLGVSLKSVNNYITLNRTPASNTRARIYSLYAAKKDQLRFIIRNGGASDLAYFLAHRQQIADYIAKENQKKANSRRGTYSQNHS